MEDSLENKISNKVEHIFRLKEIFEKIAPFFISIGMTHEQFWDSDPTLAYEYLEAFKMKQKREISMNKWVMWEQGLYIYEALCDVSPIIRAFSKATKPLPYPTKPHDLDIDNNNDDEIKKKEIENKKIELARTQIFIKNWANANINKFKKEGG